MATGCAELTAVTLDPGLAEAEGVRAEQGYTIMLSRDVLVRVSQYLFHLTGTGSSNGLRVEGIKNRVADHQGIRYQVSRLKPVQLHKRYMGASQCPAP